MAVFLLLLLIFFTASARPPTILFPRAIQSSSSRSLDSVKSSNLPYTTHYFAQVIDHFSYGTKSYDVFNQKYLMNSTFWEKGGPIFVYTGNEGDIEWFAANTGFMMDIGPKFRALLVFIEHRYYGTSLPFGKDSFKSADTLGFLNSAQALADYAVLIRNLKQNISAESSPVVVFGGSYGGMLAAWFRLKYPHIAIGALASSAPILQFEDITPWNSFYDAISKDFKDESLNCFEVIKKSWDELTRVSSEKNGLSKLSKIFKSCKKLDSVDKVSSWLYEAFIYTPMVDYPTEANFLKPLPANPVREMCRIIDGFSPEISILTKVFSAASLYYNYSGSLSCFIGQEVSTHGLGHWGWQSCTEMVMPMSSSNESVFPTFTYNYTNFADNCLDRYGVQPRPNWITTEYGGHNIKQVLSKFGSNIIFSNGLKDPWSRGGVLENLSSSIVALVTPKGAHHLDLRYAIKEDPSWLVEQRKKEVEIIRGWIEEYNEGINNVKK